MPQMPTTWLLRSEGMFVPVSGGTDGTLVNTDSIAANAKAVELFSYVLPDERR